MNDDILIANLPIENSQELKPDSNLFIKTNEKEFGAMYSLQSPYGLKTSTDEIKTEFLAKSFTQINYESRAFKIN